MCTCRGHRFVPNMNSFNECMSQVSNERGYVIKRVKLMMYMWEYTQNVIIVITIT